MNTTKELNNQQNYNNQYINNNNKLIFNSCLSNINKQPNFITLLLNKTIYKYNLHHNKLCTKCTNFNTCFQYINKLKHKLLNFNTNTYISTPYTNFNNNSELNIKTIKLNTNSVTLTSTKTKSKNIKLIHKLQYIKRTNKQIPILTL